MSNSRHIDQLKKWAKEHGITAPTGTIVEAFSTAMGDNQYGVEETWDAFCWFQCGFNSAVAPLRDVISRVTAEYMHDIPPHLREPTALADRIISSFTIPPKPRTKAQCLDAVVREFNLDISDPFTRILAAAFALQDAYDEARAALKGIK